MPGPALERMLFVLLLAQIAFGVASQEPADSESEPGTPETEDSLEAEQARSTQSDAIETNAPSKTVNFVGKAGGGLESFGQGNSRQMPYHDFEVFGRADTAAELTRRSMEESDKMIDQIERAEVAETKRSVYRSLTRLRGAATAAFDGVARSQVGNLDEYANTHRYLDSTKIKHLADEESNTEMWAFPGKDQGLLSIKKNNPGLYRDLLTSDEVERRAREIDKKASFVASSTLEKSQNFWDNLMMKEAENAATHAAKSNSGAGWHMVDSFLTGAN